MDLEKCPFCGASVKEENLQWHYRRVHPKRAGTLLGQQTLARPRPTHRNSHRRIILTVVILVLLIGVTVFILNPGSTGASFAVSASPQTVEIGGPGIRSFDVTVTPQKPSTSSVVLSIEGQPTWVSATFEPSTLNLAENPMSSRVTLIVGSPATPTIYQIRVVAETSAESVESTVALRISNPSPSKHAYLVANSSGWNYTNSGMGNPPITVSKGQTFALTAVSIPNDIHHYLSIYPSGTLPSQVGEGSQGYYVRTSFAWSHYPGEETITFTSSVTGTLEYYCDSHPDAMHGTITVEA